MNIMEESFTEIMGATSMPPDSDPYYDRWLFNATWQAAILAERERCAKIADKFGEIGSATSKATGRSVAAAIRRGEGE